MTKPGIIEELKSYAPRPAVMAAGLVLIAVLVFCYAYEIGDLVQIWWSMPDYGHGFFVPVFSLFLLWHRRDMMKDSEVSGGHWWGIAFFVIWASMRLTSALTAYVVVDRLSIIPMVAGITLFLGGWRAFRWAWPAILFLVFMIPLPGFVDEFLRQPLQRIGTVVSVYVIQTLGIPAVAQGNVIVLTEGQLGVVEACSGLRMLMLFLAVCIGAVFVLRISWWEKIIVVVSAFPIAIIANVFRITLTAVLHELVSSELADKVFHDMAGLLMMPVALLLLWAELALLSHIFLEPVTKSSLSVSLAAGLREAEGLGKEEDRQKV